MSVPDRSLILITGVGYRTRTRCTPDMLFGTQDAKPNIGACVALEAVRKGHPVVLVSRSEDSLQFLQEALTSAEPLASVLTRTCNMLVTGEVSELVASLPDNGRVHLVQSLGLSGGGYEIPEDNPYQTVESTPPELPTLEFDAVVRPLLNTVQALMPRWTTQKDTRLVVVGSMSGVRAYTRGYSHASAKGGLHLAVRALTLELQPRNIFVTEVMPGIVDTGLYDSPAVQQSVSEVFRSFGQDVSPCGLPSADPEEIARLVMTCVHSDAHILQVNVVARGQFPHLAS